MRGDTTRATPWICDACGTEVVRTDLYQDIPPEGWRLIGLWPTTVNLALEASTLREIQRAVMCPCCLAAPVIVKDMFG